ncbi:MAG TPA: guanylate kinase [Thermoanaerobaculia bacterium]|nr:guanylate kinase [Thermoanaerobaculia bacterium]
MSNNPNLHPDGTLFIVSGPSGAGKTTLIRQVQEELRGHGVELHFSISHTTREPREGEVRGENYFYVSRDEFNSMVSRGEFLEWAHVHQQMYGTSRQEVLTRLARGEDVILDIDVQGARQIAEIEELRAHSMSVFVFPPSFAELEKRISRRGLNTASEVQTRMEKAYDEIVAGLTFYDYVIINGDLQLACECLKAAILARKLKSKSAVDSLRLMAERFREERIATTRGN